MKTKPYRVGVVLHEDYGDRLVALLARIPVWIVGTPRNCEAAQRVWSSRPSQNHLTGLTTFKVAADMRFSQRAGRPWLSFHVGPELRRVTS